jgi:hypothetical protein
VGDWGYLRSGLGEPTAATDVDAATACLAAKYDVPVLWPALLDATDADRASAGQRWFVTRTRDAVGRLRALAAAVGTDVFFGTVWESLAPMIDWLTELAPDSSLVVDLRELEGLQGSAAMRARVTAAATGFLELRLRWSTERARALLPRWLDLPDVAAATLAARRFTRLNEPRAALLSAAFGWPSDRDVRDRRWQPWFDAGPSAPPPPSPLEEGARLGELLEQRGLAGFSNTPTARKFMPRYLATALRDRRAETLLDVLEVMRQQGVVRELRRDLAALADALAALDAMPDGSGNR